MWEIVDDYLQQARDLLGTGAGPTPSDPPQTPPHPTPPGDWSGPAADAATAKTQTLDNAHGQLNGAGSRTDLEVVSATDIARTAHRGLTSIQTDWENDKETLGPFADTPEGQAALNQAGMQRIGETQALVNDAANQFGQRADNVRNAQLDLPTTDSDAPKPGDDQDPDDPTGRHAHGTRGDPSRRGPGPDDPDATQTGRPAPQTTLDRPAPAPGPTPTGAMPMSGAPTGSAMPPAAAMPTSSSTPLSAGSGLASLLQPLTQHATTPADATDVAERHQRHRHDRQANRDGDKVVTAAQCALGLPYVWGGGNTNGPTGGGFDCSGLVQYSVAQATNGQLILPRSTYEQIALGHQVAPGDAQPDDLVFSNFSAPNVPEHVQIYAGDGRVIEAPQPGEPVKYSALPAGPFIVNRIV